MINNFTWRYKASRVSLSAVSTGPTKIQEGAASPSAETEELLFVAEI